MPDPIDRIVAFWKRERPKADVSSIEVVARADRIMDFVERELEAKFAEFDISKADWEVLAALLRVGNPYKMMQRDLVRELCRTSGNISIRIDALVRDELVIREQGADDRRSAFVSLTPKGLKTIESVLPEHLANQSRLLAGLTSAERSQLVYLLKKWMAGLELEDSADGVIHLGITVINPRASLMKRRAVGLPDVRGVLIEAVESTGTAATAGLRRGDLIIGIDEVEVTSIATLQRSLQKNPHKPKRIRVLRGSESICIDLDPGSER